MFIGLNFARSHIYVFYKTDLVTGGSGKFVVFSLPPEDQAGQVPAIGSTSTPTSMYLLQAWNGNIFGTGFVRLWQLRERTGFDPGPPPTVLYKEVHLYSRAYLGRTGVAWDSNAPAGDFGPQLDSVAKIDLGDSRLGDVACLPGAGSDNYLYGTHTVFLPAGAPTYSAVQFWAVRTNFVINHLARIEDPPTPMHPAVFYAFPSLDVTGLHSVLIGFAKFSAKTYPGASWAFRWGGDPPDTLQLGGTLKSGEGPYNNVASGTENRWGDYTSTRRDPGGAIWTIQEYARPPVGMNNQSGRWGTWWGKFELFEIG